MHWPAMRASPAREWGTEGVVPTAVVSFPQYSEAFTSVLEQRVPVGAALVGQPGDRVHPLVVVVLDLVQLEADAARRPRAERLRDVALLPRGLDALIAEDRRHAGQDGDLRVDVGQGGRQALVVHPLVGDLAPVAPE